MPKNTIANMKVGSREHFEFSRLLVNTIQEYAIFLLDPTGHIATWNPGAQKLKGYLPQEIIGKHFSTFYPQVDIDARKPDIELEIAERDGHVEDEGWRIRKDGTRFWANVVITALRDDTGKLVGFAKVTRDLSERRKHEEELRLANSKLMRQSAELRELNKAKDEFISLASHQLRTPASGVKQFLGLVLEGFAGELSDTQREYIVRANESNNRQIELINDLLRVAQIDAGKVTLQLGDVNLCNLIMNVIYEQRSKFNARKQSIVTDLPGDDMRGSVDEKRFRMVLENLIDNASKYTPEGGEITVRLNLTDDAIVIAISDTGVGIDTSALPKLFNKFSRIPNELSEKVGGSGLGLYWAQRIVELHHGTITVESQSGKGSTFAVILPRGSDA